MLLTQGALAGRLAGLDLAERRGVIVLRWGCRDYAEVMGALPQRLELVSF